MGDFYEILGEDAIRAAPVLEIALTLRGKGSGSETPMCGVPHFALEAYLPKPPAGGFSPALPGPPPKADRKNLSLGKSGEGRGGDAWTRSHR